MQSKIKDKMQAMIASQMRIVAEKEAQQQTQKAQTTIKKNNNDFREEKKKDAEVQKDSPEFAQQEHETALDVHNQALQAKIAAEKAYNSAHDNYKATFKEYFATQQQYLAIQKAFQIVTEQRDAASEHRSNMQNAFNEASKNELDASNKAMETAYNKKKIENEASKKAARMMRAVEKNKGAEMKKQKEQSLDHFQQRQKLFEEAMANGEPMRESWPRFGNSIEEFIKQCIHKAGLAGDKCLQLVQQLKKKETKDYIENWLRTKGHWIRCMGGCFESGHLSFPNEGQGYLLPYCIDFNESDGGRIRFEYGKSEYYEEFLIVNKTGCQTGTYRNEYSSSMLY